MFFLLILFASLNNSGWISSNTTIVISKANHIFVFYIELIILFSILKKKNVVFCAWSFVSLRSPFHSIAWQQSVNNNRILFQNIVNAFLATHSNKDVHTSTWIPLAASHGASNARMNDDLHSKRYNRVETWNGKMQSTKNLIPKLSHIDMNNAHTHTPHLYHYFSNVVVVFVVLSSEKLSWCEESMGIQQGKKQRSHYKDTRERNTDISLDFALDLRQITWKMGNIFWLVFFFSFIVVVVPLWNCT